MKDSKFVKSMKDVSPAGKLAVIVLLGLLLFIFFFVGYKHFTETEKAEITQDQIKIQKGDDIVIINRNGLIEYRTKDKVFYRTWDSAKISAFFDSMEFKARQYLSNPSAVNTPGCYLVTLWLDGGIVTVCIGEDDELIEEIFDEIDNGDGGDVSISDFFDDGNDNNDGFGISIPTPTLPPGTTATPTPPSGGGGDSGPSPEDNYPPVKADCINWSQDIVNKAIISNTLCTVEE